MNRKNLAAYMSRVFEQDIMALSEAGQKEYSHNADNAFANFERIAEDLELSREMVLWVYAMKHRDGIAAYLKGHESQREDVTGRIDDLIVYLFILRAMIEEERDDDMEQTEVWSEDMSDLPKPDIEREIM